MLPYLLNVAWLCLAGELLEDLLKGLNSDRQDAWKQKDIYAAQLY